MFSMLQRFFLQNGLLCQLCTRKKRGRAKITFDPASVFR